MNPLLHRANAATTAVNNAGSRTHNEDSPCPGCGTNVHIDDLMEPAEGGDAICSVCRGQTMTAKKIAWQVGRVGKAHGYIWVYGNGRVSISDTTEWHEYFTEDHPQMRGLIITYPRKKIGYVLAYKGTSHSSADFIPTEIWNSIQKQFPGYELFEEGGIGKWLRKCPQTWVQDFVPEGRPPEAHNTLLASKKAVDNSGHIQVRDADTVVQYILKNGPQKPAQVALQFGCSAHTAEELLEILKAEGRLGVQQGRYFVQKDDRFAFQSKLLYRSSPKISPWQEQQIESNLPDLPTKEAGPQGDDISQRSNGDYPELEKVAADILKPGTRVRHRKLGLEGTVVEPVGLGVDKGWTTLVHFDVDDDDDAREVTTLQLEIL